MLSLYSGTGSQQVEVLDPVFSDEHFAILARSVRRFLEDSGQHAAAAAIQELPFTLCNATNDFNDQFEILHAYIPSKKYVELEQSYRRLASTYATIAEAFENLNHALRFIVVDVDMTAHIEPVAPPTLKQTSDVVDRALSDAEILIRSKGATSGLDRVHTAFHGYLKLACTEAKINFNHDADTAKLFSLLRQHHPRLLSQTPGDRPVQQALRGLARVVDALNPARNESSLAHPNENLLEDPEAMLLINAIRTLLHYLDTKIR